MSTDATRPIWMSSACVSAIRKSAFSTVGLPGALAGDAAQPVGDERVFVGAGRLAARQAAAILAAALWTVESLERSARRAR